MLSEMISRKKKKDIKTAKNSEKIPNIMICDESQQMLLIIDDDLATRLLKLWFHYLYSF